MLAARGALEHDPVRRERPSQQIECVLVVGDLHAGEADRFESAVAIDGDRAAVFDGSDANHRRVGSQSGEQTNGEDENSMSHCVFFVVRASVAAKTRSGGRAENSTDRCEVFSPAARCWVLGAGGVTTYGESHAECGPCQTPPAPST